AGGGGRLGQLPARGGQPAGDHPRHAAGRRRAPRGGPWQRPPGRAGAAAGAGGVGGRARPLGHGARGRIHAHPRAPGSAAVAACGPRAAHPPAGHRRGAVGASGGDGRNHWHTPCAACGAHAGRRGVARGHRCARHPRAHAHRERHRAAGADADQPAAAGGRCGARRRNAARDRLLDLDLDTLERMHELTLTVHALAFLIDRLDEVDSAEPLQSARTDFAGHLALLDRRVRDIPDPAARAQGRQLHDVLASALASGGAVDLRSLEIELRARSDGLQNEVGSLTTELDALAGELIHRGGRILASAGSAAERSATSGLIAFGVIAAALLLVTAGVSWYVLRRHTLGRLLDLEQATLALAAGQRDVVIDTTGDDEIASLSRALERFRNDAIERDRLAEAL